MAAMLLLALALYLQPVSASSALAPHLFWMQRGADQITGAPDPTTEKLEREAQKQRNLKRQQDIREDSEKLLELATELKQYVDKTNENIISLDVIKKADQIEKLAKSVKEKMKAQ